MRLKRIQNIAHFFSWIFHPILMPLWVVLLTINANPFFFDRGDTNLIIKLLGQVFVNFVAFPILSIVLMAQLQLVKSVQLQSHRERIFPFVATGTFYVWGYEVLHKSEIPLIITKPLLGVVISLFAAFLINAFTKISVHAIGIAGFVTTAIILNIYSAYSLLPVISLAIILAGIVCSSRVIIHAHNLNQVLLGTFVGVLSMVIGFYV